MLDFEAKIIQRETAKTILTEILKMPLMTIGKDAEKNYIIIYKQIENKVEEIAKKYGLEFRETKNDKIHN